MVFSLYIYSSGVTLYIKLVMFFLSTESSNGSFNIKASSGYKFGCLAKIVNYMKVSIILEKDAFQSPRLKFSTLSQRHP